MIRRNCTISQPLLGMAVHECLFRNVILFHISTILLHSSTAAFTQTSPVAHTAQARRASPVKRRGTLQKRRPLDFDVFGVCTGPKRRKISNMQLCRLVCRREMLFERHCHDNVLTLLAEMCCPARYKVLLMPSDITPASTRCIGGRHFAPTTNGRVCVYRHRQVNEGMVEYL